MRKISRGIECDEERIIEREEENVRPCKSMIREILEKWRDCEDEK